MKSRFLFFAIGAVVALAAAWCFIGKTASISGPVETQIQAVGPQLGVALAAKSTFEHTANGYEPSAEAPQAPAGLKPAELQAWLAMAQRHAGTPPLAITFPEHYSTGTEVRGEGMAVTLKPLGSNAAPAQIENGKLVYHNAYGSTDSLQAVSGARSEEFLLLHDAGAPQRFEYDIAASSGVKDLSLKDDTIHFKNAQGRQLEIEAPWLVEAGGQRVANGVHWELSHPNGASQSRLTLVVSNAGQLHYPVVIDPSWVATSSVMNSARTAHTATLLNNGKVLVAGGFDPVGNPVAIAEIYDPATGVWTPTGTMNAPRFYHTATLLQNGEVLVAGGTNSGSGFDSAELYDPATGLWTLTGSLHDLRYEHTATLLPDGDVLVAAGSQSGPYLSSAELYHTATGTWTVTGNLSEGRYGHTATLLPSGQVMVTGGVGILDGTQSALAGTELYNPISGTWTQSGDLHVTRFYHEATLLNTGLVLVSGGYANNHGLGTSTAELYNPTSGTWTLTGSMATARDKHTATLLPTGQVLVAGGEYANQPTFSTLSTTEIYTPGTGTWSSAATLTVPHSYHTTTLLANGELLVAGGFAPTYASDISEIYDPNKPSFAATGNLSTARYGQTATLLPNGLVLVAGGAAGTSSGLTGAELYDPTQGTWTNTGSLITGRAGHTASLLTNGLVLVAGGVDTLGNFLASAELYDSSTGTWTATGSLNTARDLHTATLLPGGQVLIAGGHGTAGPLAGAELYSPDLGTWSVTGSLNAPRDLHTMTLLANGQVLVAGGEDSTGNPVASAELYDPQAATWSSTGSLNAARYRHTATLLPSGQVLIAGGGNSSGALASAELYDPGMGTFATTGSLNAAREEHTATLLGTGQVLVAAGGGPVTALKSGELYDPSIGTWTLTGNLATGRVAQTATLLPNGKALVAGGYGASINALNSAEVFDPGLGYGGTTQPQINAVPAISAAKAVIMTGAKFTGISEGSGGSKNNSASNIPVVQLQSLTNGQTVNVPLDPTQGFSAGTFNSLPPSGLTPGYAMMTMFVNGTPSKSQIVNYSMGVQRVAFLAAPQILGLDASPYTLPATTSTGLTLTYSVVSGPATVAGNVLTLTGTGTVVLAAQQAGNAGNLPFTAQQTITVVPSVGIVGWEGLAGHFSVPQQDDPSTSGMNAMPQKDGVPNLLKYLFNINPATAMSQADRNALPAVGLDTSTTPGTTYLSLTYRQYALATGVNIHVETSNDLQNWTTVTPDIWQQTGTDPVTGDPIMEVGVSMTSGGPGFIRLKVSE